MTNLLTIGCTSRSSKQMEIYVKRSLRQNCPWRRCIMSIELVDVFNFAIIAGVERIFEIDMLARQGQLRSLLQERKAKAFLEASIM